MTDFNTSVAKIEWEPVLEVVSQPNLVPEGGTVESPMPGAAYRARWYAGWLYKFLIGTVGQIVFVSDEQIKMEQQ